jgi:glycine cleavage system transcriptional repressor
MTSLIRIGARPYRSAAPYAAEPMRHFALTAVGRDRPGIVAGITAVLLAHDVNVEDSQMTILRGHFTMMLIVAAGEQVDDAALAADLRAVGEELELELLTIGAVDELATADEPEPSHIVSVYGVDHPGIVHAVSSALAERGITITDLTTRLVTESDEPLYALMMEVAIPADAVAEVTDALTTAGTEQGVEVTVRRLEADAL